MKKIAAFFLVIGIMALSAYLYVNHSLSTPGFTPAQARDTALQTKPSESFLDLKPKLIEKLQQLVKEGSNGLYNLFIQELKPDILNSTVYISKASLVPDTAAMNELDGSKQLPDEIFRIRTDSIWIEGLGLKDFLSKKVVDVKSVHILRPEIDVYNRQRTYNRNGKSQTLYQRLMNQMEHIGIAKVVIHDGTLVSHNLKKNTSTRFNKITANLTNMVIDSTTQFDKSRFLFASEAELTLKDYVVPSSNNLYTFRIGTLSIQATRQLLTAKNILLQPHYSRQEFQKHITAQKERYSISIPSIEFRRSNWWNLINYQILEAKYVQINKADVNVYLDRRKPLGTTNMAGFPHQLIMKLPLKIKIEKLKVDDLDIVYEEFSNLSNQTGKVYANNLHGTISNLTNLPGVIKRNKTTTVSASGIFMHTAPVTLGLHFDLSNYKTGEFSARLTSTQGFDGPIVNSIAKPLGLFMVKTGKLKEIASQVRGDNSKASGNVLMLYDDLHITPMKPDPANPGDLKKKSVTSLIANTFVLKDENPSKDGVIRKVDASFTRKKGTFFNLVWKTTFVGILKTIGAPEKLAYQ